MLSLEEVPVHEFRRLRHEWNALLQEYGLDVPFLRHEWLCALAETIPGLGRRPLIVRLRYKGTYGYAPLMWVRGYPKRWIPLRRLHFLGAQLTEFADFLMPESPPELWRAFFQALGCRGWVEFVGHYLSESSPHLAAYAELVRTWSGARLEPYEPCWYIPIAGRSWEEYLREEAGREFVIRGVRRREALYARVDWQVEQYGNLHRQRLRKLCACMRSRSTAKGGARFLPSAVRTVPFWSASWQTAHGSIGLSSLSCGCSLDG